MMGVVQVTDSMAEGRSHDVRIWDAGNDSTPDQMGFLDNETKLHETRIATGGTVVWVNDGTLAHDVALESPRTGIDHGAFEIGVTLLAFVSVAIIVWSRLRRPG